MGLKKPESTGIEEHKSKSQQSWFESQLADSERADYPDVPIHGSTWGVEGTKRLPVNVHSLGPCPVSNRLRCQLQPQHVNIEHPPPYFTSTASHEHPSAKKGSQIYGDSVAL